MGDAGFEPGTSASEVWCAPMSHHISAILLTICTTVVLGYSGMDTATMFGAGGGFSGFNPPTGYGFDFTGDEDGKIFTITTQYWYRYLPDSVFYTCTVHREQRTKAKSNEINVTLFGE